MSSDASVSTREKYSRVRGRALEIGLQTSALAVLSSISHRGDFREYRIRNASGKAGARHTGAHKIWHMADFAPKSKKFRAGWGSISPSKCRNQGGRPPDPDFYRSIHPPHCTPVYTSKYTSTRSASALPEPPTAPPSGSPPAPRGQPPSATPTACAPETESAET